MLPSLRLCNRLSLAAVVFAAGVLAMALPALGQASASQARLQALVNDAAVQLRLSFRNDPAERQLRHEMLGKAIIAWNQSARTEADNDRLTEWLRLVMQASMPGSREALPPVPEFPRPLPPAERAPATTEPRDMNETNSTEAKAGEPKSSSADMPSTDAKKDRADTLPTFDEERPAQPQQGGSETVLPSAGSTESKSEQTAPAAGIEKSAAQPPVNDTEVDPFRDDPLPLPVAK